MTWIDEFLKFALPFGGPIAVCLLVIFGVIQYFRYQFRLKSEAVTRAQPDQLQSVIDEHHLGRYWNALDTASPATKKKLLVQELELRRERMRWGFLIAILLAILIFILTYASISTSSNSHLPEPGERDDRTSASDFDDPISTTPPRSVITSACRASAMETAEIALGKKVSDAIWDDCTIHDTLFYRTGREHESQDYDYDTRHPPTIGTCLYSVADLRWHCDSNRELSVLEYNFIVGCDYGTDSYCQYYGPEPATLTHADFNKDGTPEFGYQFMSSWQFEGSIGIERSYFGLWFLTEGSRADYVICSYDAIDDDGYRVGGQCQATVPVSSELYRNTVKHLQNNDFLEDPGPGTYQHFSWASAQLKISEDGSLIPVPVDVGALLDNGYLPAFIDDHVQLDGHWHIILKAPDPEDIKLLIRVAAPPSQCILEQENSEILYTQRTYGCAESAQCDAFKNGEIVYAWASSDRDKWLSQIGTTTTALWFIETPNTLSTISYYPFKIRRFRVASEIESLDIHDDKAIACTGPSGGNCGHDVNFEIPAISTVPTVRRDDQGHFRLDDGVVTWVTLWGSGDAVKLGAGIIDIAPPSPELRRWWPTELVSTDYGALRFNTVSSSNTPISEICEHLECSAYSFVADVSGVDDDMTADVWITGISNRLLRYKATHIGSSAPRLTAASMAELPGFAYVTHHHDETVLRPGGLAHTPNEWSPIFGADIPRGEIDAAFSELVTEFDYFESDFFDSPDFEALLTMGALGHPMSVWDFELTLGAVLARMTERKRSANEGEPCSFVTECHNDDVRLDCSNGTCVQADCPF